MGICEYVEISSSTLKVGVLTDGGVVKVHYEKQKIATPSSVLKCSDDSEWGVVNTFYCLKQIAFQEWEATADFDGDEVTIYYDLTGAINAVYFTIYSAANLYFHTGVTYPWNELIKGDCGNAFRVDRIGQNRTVVAYGGTHSVAN